MRSVRRVLRLCTLLQDLPPRGEWDGLPLHPGPSGTGGLEATKGVEELDHPWLMA